MEQVDTNPRLSWMALQITLPKESSKLQSDTLSVIYAKNIKKQEPFLHVYYIFLGGLKCVQKHSKRGRRMHIPLKLVITSEKTVRALGLGVVVKAPLSIIFSFTGPILSLCKEVCLWVTWNILKYYFQKRKERTGHLL